MKIEGVGYFRIGTRLDRFHDAPFTVEAPASSRDAVARGKIAVVTGGAQGFGETLVRGLFAAGAIVAVADLNRTGAEKLAEELIGGRRSAPPLRL